MLPAAGSVVPLSVGDGVAVSVVTLTELEVVVVEGGSIAVTTIVPSMRGMGSG